MAVRGAPSHPAVARAAGRQGAAAAAAHAPVRPCLGPQRAQAARRHATVLAGRSVTVEVEPSQGASGGAATGVTRPKRAPKAKAPMTRVDHGLGNAVGEAAPAAVSDSEGDETDAVLPSSQNGILDASEVPAPDFSDMEPQGGPVLVAGTSAGGSLDLASSGGLVTASEADVRSLSLSQTGPMLFVTRPLPRVLLLHTGGTLGMDPNASFSHPDEGDGNTQLKEGTGGVYTSVNQLQPGRMLSDLLAMVPELRAFANMSVRVHCNKDSCRIGPSDWLRLAKTLHAARPHFDAFVVVHGTDTMAYTASALSLLLAGFRKPIILTGSQLPLAMPRSDARQNLIDSLTCATASFSPPHVHCGEVCICFGGLLLRGNRARKTNSSAYSAFSTPSYPPLATLGVDVDWNVAAMLNDQQRGVYRPRFKLNPNVMRMPIVPGCDPRQAYGDVYGRGVRGVVLEAFGVGNMPDLAQHGWIPWLRQQRKRGLQVYLASQCGAGALHPELYRSGSLALELGVQAGPQMTPETASVKLMLCLAHPDLPLSQPIAGEL